MPIGRRLISLEGGNTPSYSGWKGMAELKRTLGLWGAAGVGIGAIIGTGIFVLIGVASGIAGPAVILSFLIAGFTALLTGLSTAELSSFITESGGSYIYTTKAFGRLPGFVIGWMKSFDYIVGASAVSIGFAAYFAYFLGIPPAVGTLVLVGTLWPLILMILNLRGMKEASGTNNVLVFLKISALVLFIAVGGLYLFTHGDPSNYHPFFPRGISGALSGASIIFFAFIGFNTIAVIAEEVKDPEKNVPKAVLIAFAICTFLYIGVSVVSVGLLNWQVLGGSSAPLEAALRVATGNFLILEFIALSALFATTSVILASIMGGSRALFAMARQRVIPGAFARISAQGIPVLTVLITGIAIGAIVLLTNGNLDWLASIFNFGTLVTFLFINLSLLRLRRTMPDAKRGFRVPLYPLTPVVGVASCLLLSFYLSTNALLVGLGWVAIGIIAYAVNRKRYRDLPEGIP
jgi:APA family basic amino acid/polyamine antiporter